MVVLGNLTILASYKTLEFTKTFEALLQRALLTLSRTTIFPVNVLCFVQVFLWKAFSTLVNCFLIGLVPSGPRAQRFDFRELATGRTIFHWKGDEEVRDKALAVPSVMKVTIILGGRNRNEGAEESVGFCISDYSAVIDEGFSGC